MAERRKTTGRPPKYTSADAIVQLIDEYFKSCEGHALEAKDGEPMLDKYGYPIIVKSHPPTVTGLALALGFNCRLSLINYQGKKEFRDVITRAKSRIEAYTEERLFDKDGSNGAKFSLQNNFKGWNEASSAAAAANAAAAAAVKIICDIPKAESNSDGDTKQQG